MFSRDQMDRFFEIYTTCNQLMLEGGCFCTKCNHFVANGDAPILIVLILQIHVEYFRFNNAEDKGNDGALRIL